MGWDSLAAVPMTATYFQLLPGILGLPRAAVDQALASARLSAASISEPDREITVGEQLEVFSDLVRRLLPDGWLMAGRRFHVGTHGALGFASWSAPDVRTSLEILERFGPVRLLFYVRADRDPAWRSLQPGARRGASIDPSTRVAILELIAVIRKSLLESVAGTSISGWPSISTFPAPSYADAYLRSSAWPCASIARARR
ncbi:MAG: AraC family transcriptional regulator ligand-binding domain-containing protein [Myxococcota bacterium]